MIFCFFLQISFVLLEFPSYFPQNLFPSNFLHLAKISFQKEISFKVEALDSGNFMIVNNESYMKVLMNSDKLWQTMASTHKTTTRARKRRMPGSFSPCNVCHTIYTGLRRVTSIPAQLIMHLLIILCYKLTFNH